MSAGHNAATPLGCVFPGCTLRWVNDYGRRLCSEHDSMRFTGAGEHVQKPIPETLRPASRPWQDVKENDDESLPF